MTHVVLNNAGIKSPYSFTMTNVDDIEATVDWLEKDGKLKYPIVIKTLRGTHGIGVMKLDSRASLVSVAQTLQKENMDFIIQEFMEHDQSARMIMIGDKLLAANLRGQPKDKGEFRTNSHLGSETEPYTPSEDEIALGARIVELFGCKFCAIDYLIRKQDNGTQELVILEVNGSPGLENIQKNWPDKDLAKDVVSAACGNYKTTAQTAAPTEVAVEPSAPEELPSEVVQEVEQVLIHRVINDPIDARIDTGAKYSSIHADWLTFDENWTKFRRGDVTFKVNTDRIIKIKNVHGGESSRRAMIRLDITIKGKRLNGVEFTVNDRGHMKYEVLIGRNILELLGLPVIVPQAGNVDGHPADTPESEIYTVEEE
jgi:RimK family alpha-L-glutamate ligase